MKKSVKRRWIRALTRKRNPYKQARHTLYHSETRGYCCLGVLSDIAVKDGILNRDKEGLFADKKGLMVDSKALCDEVQEWSGINTTLGKIPVEKYKEVAEILGRHGFTTIANRLDEKALWNAYSTEGNLAFFNDAGVPFSVIAEIIEVAF